MDRHVRYRRSGRLDEPAVRRFSAPESESDHRYQAFFQYIQIQAAGEYTGSGRANGWCDDQWRQLSCIKTFE